MFNKPMVSFGTAYQAAKRKVGFKLSKQGEIMQTRRKVSKDEMKKGVTS